MSGPFDTSEYFDPDEATLREIATRTRCPQVGDSARVGDTVASGIEPGTPVGRIVAFVHRNPDGTEAKGMRATLVRQYRKGDGWYPTGEVRGGALGVAWCPWVLAARYAEVAVSS